MAYLDRRRTHFVLWQPAAAVDGGESPPALVIGTFRGGTSPALADERIIPLQRARGEGDAAGPGDLWEIAASACGLTDGRVYHYWFEVQGTNAYRPPDRRVTLRCTDPGATCVDWRLLAPVPSGYAQDDRQPAAVIRHVGGQLFTSDPGLVLDTFDRVPDAPMAALPPNNRLIIYELPTAWTRIGQAVTATAVGVGTFRDVLSMLDQATPRGNFASVAALRTGRAHLLELGVNALELLPPADSFQDRSKWGYGTSNPFAPDFDLGRPEGQDASTACADLLQVARACHRNGIRLFVDVVMAFAQRSPYRAIDYLDFFVRFNDQPRDPEQADRDGFGGDLWKYGWMLDVTDPVSGARATLSPARQLHLTHLTHWMNTYHVDGFRLDSVANIRNPAFVGAFRDQARRLWRDRWTAETGGVEGADERFLVVGEELSMPHELLGQIDGLWNEHFRRRVRNALLGRALAEEPSFEWMVRQMIDCRLLGFADGAQVVNYLGSHDVTNTDADGVNNDRLFNCLDRFGVANKEERIKLGFACLLTAVGVPMIFAGDEFADAMDFDPRGAGRDDEKQCDPLNLDRLEDPWRARVFAYASRLVRLRAAADALSVNDTSFLHADFDQGKRVLVWRRGRPEQSPVVVLANFSDFATDTSRPDAAYVVPAWPPTPAGFRWREVTQDRLVPDPWIGREPIFPWEAKVYTLEATGGGPSPSPNPDPRLPPSPRR